MKRHSRPRCLREARALLKLADLADVVPRIGFDSSIGGKIDLSVRLPAAERPGFAIHSHGIEMLFCQPRDIWTLHRSPVVDTQLLSELVFQEVSLSVSLYLLLLNLHNLLNFWNRLVKPSIFAPCIADKI